MYKALDIAYWFVNRSIQDVNAEIGEYVSPLKLQKLLYYAQGCYGALKGEKLFNDKISHWDHGPVVGNVYYEFKKYKDSGVEDQYEISIDSETEAVLEEVYKSFGKFSAWGLREMTHQETPWRETASGEEITFDKIAKYCKENYITE